MQQIKIPRMMRDVDWFTNTCTAAFTTIGKKNIVSNYLIATESDFNSG